MKEYNSAHHRDTTAGDTFGGMGMSGECREESILTPEVVAEFRRASEQLLARRPASEPKQ